MLRIIEFPMLRSQNTREFRFFDITLVDLSEQRDNWPTAATQGTRHDDRDDLALDRGAIVPVDRVALGDDARGKRRQEEAGGQGLVHERKVGARGRTDPEGNGGVRIMPTPGTESNVRAGSAFSRRQARPPRGLCPGRRSGWCDGPPGPAERTASRKPRDHFSACR